MGLHGLSLAAVGATVGRGVILYAIVDTTARDHQIVDTFATREEAERALRDALQEEPEWQGVLIVVEVDVRQAAQER